jgi:hypothetical protein
MTITPSLLKTEIQQDPKGLGLAPLVAAGNDQGIADLLNSFASSGTCTAFRNNIQVNEIIAAIQPADFAALSVLQLTQLQTITGQAVFDATGANARTSLLNIFAGMTTTVAALTALASRVSSRAEVLFGAGTVISAGDVSFALRGTR